MIKICYNIFCNNINGSTCYLENCNCENGEGDKIVDRYFIGETEVIYKRKDLTCYKCIAFFKCKWRDSPYNTNGDCLAEK
jgi:hypothetical protein